MHPRHPYRVLTEYYYNWRGLKSGLAFFHTHPQYEIYYFHSGCCDYVLGERIIRLQPGDLIILNGMTSHGPKVYEPNEYVRTMFSFDPYLVQIFDQNLRACNPLQPFQMLKNYHFRLNPEARQECEDILERINRFYYQNDIVQYNRFLMAFYDLLMFIHYQSRAVTCSNRQTGTEREQYVSQLIAYIEQHFMDDLSLDDLVQNVHLSKFHLMKVFREVTGKTITDYLYERRINQAKILFLYEKEHSVTRVCYEVGFKHLAHFSRLFKKQVGLSPDSYKKLVHESGNSLS